jgi:predicted transcriptional regulator
MIAALKKMLPRIEAWPAEDQATLVAVAQEIEAERDGHYVLSDDVRAAIDEGLAQAERGEFASDHDVAAIFARARGAR